MKPFQALNLVFALLVAFSLPSFGGDTCGANPAPTCDSAHMCGKANGVCIIQVNSDASAQGVTNTGSSIGGGTMSGGQYVCVADSSVVVFAAAPSTAANFNFSADTFSPGNPFTGSGSFTGGSSFSTTAPWRATDTVSTSATGCFNYTIKVPGGCTGTPPACITNDPAVIIDNSGITVKGTRASKKTSANKNASAKSQ